MSRSVQKSGVEIVETITVYDNTGAEVTGLADGTFTKVLHKDGVAQSVAGVTVTEISGGDYKVAFTPASAGAWRLLIQHATHNKKGWQATFDVSTGGILSTADIAAAVWAFVIWVGFPASRVLRKIFSGLAANSTGGKTAAVFYAPDGVTPELTGAAAENGDRTVSNYHS